MKDENLNLNELITNAELDIKVVKLDNSDEDEIRDKREKALLKLKEYEDITSDINKLNSEREDILLEIRNKKSKHYNLNVQN